jgi:hypothetical protein
MEHAGSEGVMRFSSPTPDFQENKDKKKNRSTSISRRSIPSKAFLAIPVLIATVNVGLLLAKLSGIISTLYLSSDTASAPVIASLANPPPATQIVTLGNYSWYEALWFMQATLGLPAHRQIWEIAPIVWTALAYVVLVRAAWVLFGRWVALMTGAIVMCVTPFQQTVFFTLDTHGPLLVHACVLAGALVWLSMRRSPPGWALLVALGVPLAAFTGAGVASDQLAFVAYVIPFAAAASFGTWRFGGATQHKVFIFAIATSATAVVGGEIAAAVMRANHWAATPFRVNAVAPGHILSNLDIFIKAFSNLGGGDFAGIPFVLSNYTTFAAGALTLLALALVTLWLGRRSVHLLVREPSAPSREAAAAIYTAFWGAVLIGVCAIFILSSAPVDKSSARYLANAYIAVAVLIPLVAYKIARTPRVLMACGVGIFTALSLYGTVHEPDTANTSMLPVAPPVAGQIEQFVLSHGAQYGFARYWDAEALTWETQLRIQAYPAYNCDPPSLVICPFILNIISSWYEPQPHTRSFLVVDATGPDPLAADPASGHPIATANFGGVSVYVYNHDIAATMHEG